MPALRVEVPGSSMVVRGLSPWVPMKTFNISDGEDASLPARYPKYLITRSVVL